MSVIQKVFLGGLIFAVVWLGLFFGYWPIHFSNREMIDTHKVLFAFYVVALVLFSLGPVVAICCLIGYCKMLSGWRLKIVGFVSPFVLAWLFSLAYMIATKFTSFRVLSTLLVIAAFISILVGTIKLVFPRKRPDSIQTS